MSKRKKAKEKRPRLAENPRRIPPRLVRPKASHKKVKVNGRSQKVNPKKVKKVRSQKVKAKARAMVKKRKNFMVFGTVVWPSQR